MAGMDFFKFALKTVKINFEKKVNFQSHFSMDWTDN